MYIFDMEFEAEIYPCIDRVPRDQELKNQELMTHQCEILIKQN